MNSDLYRAVCDALAPVIIKRAYDNALLPSADRWSYGTPVRPSNEPMFDGELDLRQFTKTIKGQKEVNSVLIGAVRNCLTLLLRDSLEKVDLSSDYSKDHMMIRFKPQSIRFNVESRRDPKAYGRTIETVDYRSIIIGQRSFSADYFGLVSFRPKEENVKEETEA